MRKNSFLFLAGMLAVAACNQPLDPISDSQEVTDIVFALSPYEDEVASKTTYDSANQCFLWAAGDAVGIVSPVGGQLKFTINPEDYGKQFAKFDGRGFALMSSTSYASYYPFQADFDLDPNALPITYLGQQQTGDNSMEGLGEYSYSVAMGTAPADGGRLDFTFRNVGSPHRYRLPVLPGAFSSLTLEIPSDKFILSGTLNLKASDESSLITISPTALSNALSLVLDGTSMSSTGSLRCWLMVPPVDLSGEAIRLVLETTEGQAYVAAVAGKNCPANYRSVFNALTSVFPAFTEVGNEGGDIQVKVIKTNTTDAVTPAIGADWLTDAGSSTSGLVTTYTFTVAPNESTAREGTISFTEAATGLTNTVTVCQQASGAIIGVGGWETDNHNGHAQ